MPRNSLPDMFWTLNGQFLIRSTFVLVPWCGQRVRDVSGRVRETITWLHVQSREQGSDGDLSDATSSSSSPSSLAHMMLLIQVVKPRPLRRASVEAAAANGDGQGAGAGSAGAAGSGRYTAEDLLSKVFPVAQIVSE